MKQEIEKETLKKICESLKFHVSDEEIIQLKDDFSMLFSQYRYIEMIDDLEEETPISFPYEISTTSMKKDDNVSNLSKEDVLKNASHKEDDFVVIKKVVD